MASVYDTLLLVGAVLLLCATSSGIWNVVVPGRRQSDVPLTYHWRLLCLITGVVVFMAGVATFVTHIP